MLNCFLNVTLYLLVDCYSMFIQVSIILHVFECLWYVRSYVGGSPEVRVAGPLEDLGGQCRRVGFDWQCR